MKTKAFHVVVQSKSATLVGMIRAKHAGEVIEQVKQALVTMFLIGKCPLDLLETPQGIDIAIDDDAPDNVVDYIAITKKQ